MRSYHSSCAPSPCPPPSVLQDLSPESFSRRYHFTGSMVLRLGLQSELEGHSGCVNCLQWNRRGDRLLSGSDDQQLVLWDPFRLKALQTVRTQHTGNIFSVKVGIESRIIL